MWRACTDRRSSLDSVRLATSALMHDHLIKIHPVAKNGNTVIIPNERIYLLISHEASALLLSCTPHAGAKTKAKTT